jgi:hypothetical protein
MTTMTTSNEASSPSSTSHLSQEDISFAAYCLWEQDGRPDGHDLDHWYRAENLLRQAHAEVKEKPSLGL